jgi:hypothetical protein
MGQTHNKKHDTFPQQPDSLSQQSDSSQQNSPKEVIVYSIQDLPQEVINSITCLLDIIELACLRRANKQFYQIILFSLVMNNGNDGKVSTQERTLVPRRITLCNDWVSKIESYEKLQHLHLGDCCNWKHFYLYLERFICLQRLYMTVNTFNSEGIFCIVGDTCPSILESFMMDILSTDPETSKQIPRKYDGIIILYFSKCTNLESM